MLCTCEVNSPEELEWRVPCSLLGFCFKADKVARPSEEALFLETCEGFQFTAQSNTGQDASKHQKVTTVYQYGLTAQLMTNTL